MGITKNIVVLAILLSLGINAYSQSPQGGPHSSQGGPHQNQGRVRREAADNPETEGVADTADDQGDDTQEKAVAWTTCNVTTTPRLSCHDCSTRMICKPVGGLLKQCNNPFKPHCFGGICSAIPSPECV